MLELGAILLGAAHGLLFPLIQVLLAKELPAEGGVVFMSFNIAAIGLGQTLAPLIMSAAFEAAGLQAVFGLATVIAIAMIPPPGSSSHACVVPSVHASKADLRECGFFIARNPCIAPA